MDIVLAGWETPYVFEYGGLGVFGRNLVDALLEMGHSVVWIGCSPDPGLRRKTIHVKNGYRAHIACTVTDLGDDNLYSIWLDLVGISLEEADLLIINDMHVAPPLTWTARITGVKTVYYAHVFGGNPFEAASMMSAEAVATNSYMMKRLLEYVLDPILSNIEPKPRKPPVKVVYPALPRLPRSTGSALTPRYRALLPPAKTLILVHGRRQVNKNQEAVIEAVKKLRKNGCDAGLVISGRGWDPGVIDAHNKIVSLGEVDDEALAALYSTADIVVVPSVFEPFGMVALEAASYGKPVVLSENVGAREVLKSAPVFDPRSPDDLAEKIEHLINSPDEARKLGEKLKAEATGRTWRHVAEELLSLV